MKWHQAFLVLAGLILAPPTIAQITASSSPEQIVETIKRRSDVLSIMGDNIALQFALPPQYSQCLFVAFTESHDGNNVAKSFLLEQIDFLSNSGLSSDKITSLISYGHAVLNHSYAIEAGKGIDELSADDIEKVQKYGYRMFVKHSCVENFGDERVQKILQEIMRPVTEKR